jgi:hypothetical protein
MNSTDKLMNLIYSHTVLPRTSAPLFLTGIVGIGALPENETHPNAVFLGGAHQAKLNHNWLQDPNLFYSGREGTLALPDGRKAQGKRSFVVGQSHYTTKAEGGKANSSKEDPVIIPAGCDKLSDLLHNKDDLERRRKLIHNVVDVSTLILAYKMIKPKPWEYDQRNSPRNQFTPREIHFTDLMWSTVLGVLSTNLS